MMKSLVRMFVHNSVLTNVVIITVFGVGILTLSRIPREGLPDVTINKVIITTLYGGASAKDVELKVTAKIEDKIKGVGGIDRYTSNSSEGMSIISIETDENASDAEFQNIYDDIKSKVDEVDDLPTDLTQQPVLKTFTSQDSPVMELAIRGTKEDLREYVPRLEDELRKLETVYDIDEVGFPDREIQILIDPVKAGEHMIDFNMVAKAISSRNIEGTGGILESKFGEKKVVTLNKYSDLEQILNTNVRTSSDGTGVKVRDIAIVKDSVEDMKLEVRNNGDTGVYLLIKKKAKFDIIRSAAEMRNVIDSVPKPKSVSYSIVNDMSESTSARINLVSSNAIVGGILVFIAMFFILDGGTAFWTAFGIPFALFGTFAVIYAMGLTLNIITLGGLILVIGMLVDNSIVVAEQTSTYKEQGMDPEDASVQAVADIAEPVFASTLTTVIAFTPLMTLNGIAGKFLISMPLVVIVALLFSLFEAYFILPQQLSTLHIDQKRVQKKGEIVDPHKLTGMQKVEKFYSKIMLKYVMPGRYIMVAIFCFLLISGFGLFNKGLKMIPFPNDDSREYYITITKPVGTLYKDLEKDVKKIEKIIEQVSGEMLVGYTSRLGTDSNDLTSDRGTQNNLAMIYVYLVEVSQRDKSALQVSEEVRAEIEKLKLKGLTYTIQVAEEGPPMGRDVEIDVMFRNENAGFKTVENLKQFLKEQPGVYDVEDDQVPGKEEYNLKIDYDALNEAGLTANDILNTIKAGFDGQVVSSITDLYGTIDYRLKMNDRARKDIDFLRKLPILNSRGQIITLSKIVNIQTQPSMGVIKHVDGRQSVTVKASVNTDLNMPQKVAQTVQDSFTAEPGVDLGFEGGAQKGKEIFTNLIQAFMIAVLAMYLVICVIFKSYFKAFIVISCLPFTLVAVFYSLYWNHVTMSMIVAIGVIGLMGVVVNGSIVMLCKMIEMNESGNNDKYFPKDMIVEATSSRIRPIFLSSATTVVGLLPTAYGIGGYDTFVSPQSLAMAYGIMFGTMIVLVLVPCILDITQDISKGCDKLWDTFKGIMANLMAGFRGRKNTNSVMRIRKK